MKKKTSLSIDRHTLLKIKQAAKEQKRSVSSLVGIWLEEKFGTAAKNGKAKA